MANSIRLKRVGAKKEASFRIVVIDTRRGTAGESVERLGTYNPRTQPSIIRIDAARTLYWLNEGAQPSDTVRSLLEKTGVWKQFRDGVAPDTLEEPIVFQGPPPGEQTTSIRPMPVDKPVKPADAPKPKPEGEPKAEAAEAEAAEEAEAPADIEAAEEPSAEAEEAQSAEAEEAPAAEDEEAEATEDEAAAEASAEAEVEGEGEEEAEDAGEETKEEE